MKAQPITDLYPVNVNGKIMYMSAGQHLDGVFKKLANWTVNKVFDRAESKASTPEEKKSIETVRQNLTPGQDAITSKFETDALTAGKIAIGVAATALTAGAAGAPTIATLFTTGSAALKAGLQSGSYSTEQFLSSQNASFQAQTQQAQQQQQQVKASMPQSNDKVKKIVIIGAIGLGTVAIIVAAVTSNDKKSKK